MGRNGKFYGIGQDAIDDGTTPIAIVIYKGPKADGWHPDANGLALALEDATTTLGSNTVKWALESFLQTRDYETLKGVKQVDTSTDLINKWDQFMNGTVAFNCLIDAAVSQIGPWMDTCFNGDNSKTVITSDHTTSRWFVPTASQMAYSLNLIARSPYLANSDYYDERSTFIDNNGVTLKSEFYNELLGEMFLRLGTDGKTKLPRGQYWLTTQMTVENNWEKAWYCDISENGFTLGTDSKNKEKLLRPVISFRPSN